MYVLGALQHQGWLSFAYVWSTAALMSIIGS